MTITITPLDALIAALIIVAIILLVQLIVLVRSLIPTAKSLSKLVEDASHITHSAKEGVDGVHRIVSDMGSSLGDVAQTMRYKKGTLNAMGHAVSAVANLVNLSKSAKK